MGKYMRLKFSLTVDGESLPVITLDGALPSLETFPQLLRATFPTVRIFNVAQAGFTVTQLTSSITRRRLAFKAQTAVTNVHLLCAGTNGCVFETLTGEEMFDEQAAYAATVRALGYDYMLATTLVRSQGLMNGPANDERVDFNDRLLAAPAYPTGPFNGIIDLASNVVLADYTNNDNYPDDTHFSELAAEEAKDECVPILTPFIT